MEKIIINTMQKNLFFMVSFLFCLFFRQPETVINGVVGVVAVTAVAAMLLRPSEPLSGDYTLVCSNRSQQFTDQQWADLAAVLLDDNNNSILI